MCHSGNRFRGLLLVWMERYEFDERRNKLGQRSLYTDCQDWCLSTARFIVLRGWTRYKVVPVGQRLLCGTYIYLSQLQQWAARCGDYVVPVPVVYSAIASHHAVSARSLKPCLAIRPSIGAATALGRSTPVGPEIKINQLAATKTVRSSSVYDRAHRQPRRFPFLRLSRS